MKRVLGARAASHLEREGAEKALQRVVEAGLCRQRQRSAQNSRQQVDGQLRFDRERAHEAGVAERKAELGQGSALWHVTADVSNDERRFTTRELAERAG